MSRKQIAAYNKMPKKDRGLLKKFREKTFTAYQTHWTNWQALLYPRWKELPDANAALRAAFTFINEGKEDEKQGFRPRLVDWEQDAALIAPAVDKVLGYSCRRCGYLHWWEFLGAFHGIGDGLFAQVVNIRNKRARGKMLDKSEQEFARENAAVIKIHAAGSAEDKAEKERLLDLLGR